MKKLVAALLLFFSLITVAQVPFEYDTDGPMSYLEKVLTNEKADKWFIICNEYGDSGRYNHQRGILYDLIEWDTLYAKKRILEKKLHSKIPSVEEKAKEELYKWGIPIRSWDTRALIDSVIKAWKLNVVPANVNAGKYFRIEIRLGGIDTVRCKNLRDCFPGVFADYRLRFYNNKGLLYSDDWSSAYISKEKLMDVFNRPLFWESNGRCFGVYSFAYVGHGIDIIKKTVLFNTP